MLGSFSALVISGDGEGARTGLMAPGRARLVYEVFREKTPAYVSTLLQNLQCR